MAARRAHCASLHHHTHWVLDAALREAMLEAMPSLLRLRHYRLRLSGAPVARISPDSYSDWTLIMTSVHGRRAFRQMPCNRPQSHQAGIQIRPQRRPPLRTIDRPGSDNPYNRLLLQPEYRSRHQRTRSHPRYWRCSCNLDMRCRMRLSDHMSTRTFELHRLGGVLVVVSQKLQDMRSVAF
jgi:hypothetical protein